MLSKRQIDILLDYVRDDGEFVSSIEMARKHGVSQRTLQTDNRKVRDYIKDFGAVLESVPSKGTRLVINDQRAFEREIYRLTTGQDASGAFAERSSRVAHVLRRLANTKGYVATKRLANEMYVSRSTLSGDLAVVRDVVARYGLVLEMHQPQGVRLVGDEASIRQCIVRENVGVLGTVREFTRGAETASVEYQALSHIVTEHLSAHHFKVSDYVFQTILVHLEITLDRMRGGHYVEGSQQLEPSYQHALEVASEILHACCRLYRLEYSDAEAALLAINLQGKRELDDDGYVSKQLNDFIYHALVKVRDRFNIDLTNDMNLRLSLALHTLPLITRARYDMQLENSITIDIKQKFVLAFDAASTYAQELQTSFGIRLTDDEISFLALHFLVSLQSHPYLEDSKRVLIVSPERKSNTILIQQKLKQWLPDQIQTIDIVGPQAVETCDLDSYDAVLTTDRAVARQTGAIPIGLFLSDDEYNKINLALSGFSRPEDLVDVFDRDMFYVGPIATKDEAIRIVCKQAEECTPPRRMSRCTERRSPTRSSPTPTWATWSRCRIRTRPSPTARS